MLCEVEASGVVSITKAFHKFNWKNVSESWSRQTWIVSNIWLQSRSRLTTADDNQNMISHFWDRPVPIFSDVSFSYLALVQDKKITCVLQANACCTVYVNWIDKKTTWDIDNLCWWWITSGADPGFVVNGGREYARGLGTLAGPGQSPYRKLWGFEELQTFIWTTILNQPHHFYQTKKNQLDFES